MERQLERGSCENSEGRDNEFEGQRSTDVAHGGSAAERRPGVFHKTQICFKFMAGRCNFKSCRFAHGKEELRQALPNFQRIGAQDDQEIHRTRNSKRLRGNDSVPRDSDVINVATTSGSSEGVSQRPIYKKPFVCYQWEATGTCSYGDNCRYPHERRKLAESVEGLKNGDSATSDWKHNISNMKSQSVFKQGGGPPKPQTQNVDFVKNGDNFRAKNAFVGPFEKPMEINSSPSQAQQAKKRLAKWKWPPKISRIYGDWIDED